MATKYKQKFNPLTGDFDMVVDLAGSGVITLDDGATRTEILTGKTLNDGDNIFLTGFLGYICSEISIFLSSGSKMEEANLVNTNTVTGSITINCGLIAPETNCSIHCLLSKV